MDVRIKKNFFQCLICKKVENPCELSCCGRLVCAGKCRDQISGQMCQFCSEKIIIRKSLFGNLIMRNATALCRNQCGITINLHEEISHNKICPLKKTKCKFCLQFLLISQIVEHIYQKHEQIAQNCLEKQCSMKIVQQVKPAQKPEITVNPLIPQDSSKFEISFTGLIVCEAPFKCGRQTFKCSEGDGSCDKCMKQNCIRFNLPIGYLLNTNGRLCQYNVETRKVYCRCLSSGIFKYTCRQQSESCQACQNTNKLIQKGMYKNLL